MQGIFQMTIKETQSTLVDPHIYIHYQDFRTATRVLFLVHGWRGRDVQMFEDMLVAWRIDAGGF